MNVEFEGLKGSSFEGEILANFHELADQSVLSQLAQRVLSEEAKLLAQGRHRVVVLPFLREGKKVSVAVKCFGKQSVLKDRFDRKRGSKAKRSFEAARRLSERGVGTPDPIAYVDRWEGSRLVESYYFSIYAGELSCLRDEMNRLFSDDPDCHKVVELLTVTGKFMRQMHDAGFCHRDLGSQNIMMVRKGADRWEDIQVIDLNRGRLKDELSVEERARDFDRITVPGGFLMVLKGEYWQGPSPKGFEKAVKSYRKRYDFHARSRRWRHMKRWGKKSARSLQYKDVWLWDEKSAQASVVMSRSERKKCYPFSRSGTARFTPQIRADSGSGSFFSCRLTGGLAGDGRLCQRVG